LHFGSVTVSTPLAKSARILSVSTEYGGRNERRKLPRDLGEARGMDENLAQ
jgi:hypothetical protein